MYLSMRFNPKPMKFSLSLLAYFGSLSLLFAQRGPLFKQSAILLEQEKYEAVVEQLSAYLEDETTYADKEKLQAYFLRGQAYFGITEDPYLLGLYPDAFFKAYADLRQVTKLDEKGRFQSIAFAKIQQMRQAMLNNALQKVNEANIPGLTSAQTHECSNTAQQFLDILIEMEPRNYLLFDLRGQAKLARQDSLPAAMDFQNAIRLYKDYPPPQPDLLITYAYYRTALIQRISLEYDEQALKTIRAGRRFLEQEWNKTDQQNPVQSQHREKAAKDLTLMELDILYSKEAYRAEALQALAAAVQKYPNEYTLRCAYANLLEIRQPDKAVDQYQKAIALDPGRKMAYHNLAALYINQSVEVLQQSKPENIAEKEQTANQISSKAVPYLERAHQIDPTDKQIIRQLITIFLRTKQTDRYQLYQNRLAALSNT
jgi:tetratricopeptide (TPR) repeat protein